jgi:hypothetical protein
MVADEQSVIRKISAPLLLLLCLLPAEKNAFAAEILVTAAGDYGANDNTKSVLKRIAAIAPDIHFALGDLSYNTIPEKDWCSMVRNEVATPFLLLAGNHDTGGKEADIDIFSSCLPYTYSAPLEGIYAKEYYIDVPEKKPLARFIMISPDLKFRSGKYYGYKQNNAHATWLADAIASGRKAGIPWIIVGMHKVCISTETKNCEVGQELVDQLIAAKVDIVLSGHIHAYERTKQLACMKQNSFDPNCIVAEPAYGKGTYFVSTGTGGTALRKTNKEDTEAPYFAKIYSQNEGNYYGLTQLAISASEIKSQLIEAKTGAILDEFSIRKN